MPFAKGQSGNPKGKPKGTPNKATAALKDAILTALELTGEDMDPKAKTGGAVTYLRHLAKEHPPVFAGLLGKVLPMTVGSDEGKGRLILVWESEPER